MSRQCSSLLLSTAMLTGLYGVQAEAASGLTYSLRAEQQVFYTAQLSSQDISLTVAMQIAEDPGTAGINAAFGADAPLEIRGLSFAEPYCYGSGRAGAEDQCRVHLPGLPDSCGIPPTTGQMKSYMMRHCPLRFCQW